ncbi:unnamed protein product [Effrenium voratum]|nr:unnamed protein product [Effrenium voratum]
MSPSVAFLDEGRDSFWSDQSWLKRSIITKDLCGVWADSLGNAVYVNSAESKLEAVLSRPPRPDIHLSIRPIDGGWICGNAKLDLSWSSSSKLHWVAADGRVSVWVRLQDD